MASTTKVKSRNRFLETLVRFSCDLGVLSLLKRDGEGSVTGVLARELHAFLIYFDAKQHFKKQ